MSDPTETPNPEFTAYREALSKVLAAGLDDYQNLRGGDPTAGHARDWLDWGNGLFGDHPAIPPRYKWTGKPFTKRSAWWCVGYLAFLADNAKDPPVRVREEDLITEAPWPAHSFPAGEFGGGYREAARDNGRAYTNQP